MAPKVVVITDPRHPDDRLCAIIEAVAGAAAPGELVVQVRDKLRQARRVLALAERLSPICERHGAALVVNDRIDIALAVNAAGVHLGGASVEIAEARRLLPSGWISIAAHTLEDVERAEGEGADAAFLSPIFSSPGKGAPLGTRALEGARARAARIGLYALGGVDVANAGQCRRAGASGVAVLRALLDAPDPAAAMGALRDALR
jgi:thiamine-phosphate pyrophosphorylase